jgi:cytochrome P450
MGLLHLPESDTPLIAELSPQTHPAGPDAVEISQQVNAHFRAYVEERIEERRARPLDDDILSDLVVAQDSNMITSDELWATVQTLILAGHETTSSALAIGLHLLLNNRDQTNALNADRSLLPNAAEEILRFDSPVESMTRVLAEEVGLQGVALSPGTLISLCIASANRDPREFAAPDVFNIRRSNARSQLSFGVGIHRCTGAPLAQMELPIALGVLFDRLESVEFDAVPSYAPGFFRQFETLRLGVRLRPRDTS